MRDKRIGLRFLAVGVMALWPLLAAACEPPLPTVETQAQPTDTSVLPADTPAPTSPPATPTPTPTEAKTEEEGVTPTTPAERGVVVQPEAEKAVAAAKADLMERLGVREEAIVVKAAEAVQWPDSSLGCPQPGMMYAQVITPGFRVVLEVAGQTYEYHTDAGRLVVLCGADGGPFDPVPLMPVMPVAPHGVRPGKPGRPAD